MNIPSTRLMTENGVNDPVPNLLVVCVPSGWLVLAKHGLAHVPDGEHAWGSLEPQLKALVARTRDYWTECAK